jgi:outer membrane biosynthesis protein TonB
MPVRPHLSVARPDTVRIPVLWLAVALSLALHALVLFGWLPQFEPITVDPLAADKPRDLVVQLVPEARRPGAQAQLPAPADRSAPPPPPRRGLPEKPRAQPPSPPPAVPFNRPAPYVPVPAPPPTAKPAPAPPETDLAAYVEARRRARGETAAAPAPPEPAAPSTPQESEEERRNRIVAANLGLDRAPSFGGDPRTGGGIFQITRMGYLDAEFLFFGWNKDIKRNSRQRIEVAKGDHADIRIAVIRRMIGIIRDHEKGDFTWVSHRLGREVRLSARPADTAGLEDFLMREFFPGG